MREKIHNNQKGITLLALVITIIVLLILAGVSIMGGLGSSGILSRASEAVTKYNEAAEIESNMDESFLGIPGEILAILPNGTKLDITVDTLKDYIGQNVTNFQTGEAPKQEITIGTKLITVASTYRLYYIDYEGKYGEKGTVYLKADEVKEQVATGNNSTYNEETNKLKAFNPSLFKDGVTPPNFNNNGMKKAMWLLDTEIWANVVQDETLKNLINFVVGAPSVELFMDSYNTYYGLTGDEPEILKNSKKRTAASLRTKLFYSYPCVENNTTGYYVGPADNSATGYGKYTGAHTVQADLQNGNLYFPTTTDATSDLSYYLASPSAQNADKAMRVIVNSNDGSGGFVSYDNKTAGFCPIVSLKTGFELKLEEQNSGE